MRAVRHLRRRGGTGGVAVASLGGAGGARIVLIPQPPGLAGATLAPTGDSLNGEIVPADVEDVFLWYVIEWLVNAVVSIREAHRDMWGS